MVAKGDITPERLTTSVIFTGMDTRKATQILRALEGLSICEAEEMLETCKQAITFLTVSYPEIPSPVSAVDSSDNLA